MSELIHIRRKGAGYKINLDLKIEIQKAETIAKYISDDAGQTDVKIQENETRAKLKAKAIVSPVTMRQILNTLAQ